MEGVTSTDARARPYFVWLDPLRAFAAVTVLVYHLIALGGLPMPAIYPLTWFHFGWLGVDLFYAISGAVIVLTLDHLRRHCGPHWRGVFALRRVARVVPLYLLTGTVFLILHRPELLDNAAGWRVILAHLLFIQNWFLSTHGAINGPSWTLGVEMQFYALALLAGPWFLRARLLHLALLLGCIAVAWRATAWWYFSHQLGDPNARAHFVYATQLPGVIDVFGGGILAARWWLLRQRSAPVLPLLLLALLAWLGVLATLHLGAHVFWSDPLVAVGFRSTVAVAAGLSVAATLAATRTRPGGLMRWSGDLSYAIYLWHMPILLLLLPRWDHGPLTLGFAVLASTLLIGIAGFVALERPMQRLAKRTPESPRPILGN